MLLVPQSVCGRPAASRLFSALSFVLSQSGVEPSRHRAERITQANMVAAEGELQVLQEELVSSDHLPSIFYVLLSSVCCLFSLVK